MKFNLDIKTLVFLVTLVASACGIYYTMQNRIAGTESRIETVEEALKKLTKRVNKNASGK